MAHDFIGDLRNAITERIDGWVNTITTVGMWRGKNAFQYMPDVRESDMILESATFGDAYASRICSAVPEEALRRGFKFKATFDGATNHGAGAGSAPDGMADELAVATAIGQWFDAHHVSSKAVEAWTWARTFGGAAWLVGADDGQDPSMPLDLDRLRTIHYVAVVDKRWLSPVRWFSDPMSPNYGEPSHYQLQRQGATRVDSRVVHASRIIRWEGAMTNPQRRFANNSWSESELQRCLRPLQKFNGAYEAVGTLMQEASIGVIKIKGLMASMSQDGDDLMKKRLAVMDESRSVAHALMLDADGEDFTRTAVSFAGIPDTLDKFILYLAGSSRIPVTRLMGQSPAGLAATGDNDMRMFYDDTDSARVNYLKPNLLRLALMLCACLDGPTRGVVPRLDVVFPSMYALTPLEEADVRQKQSVTDTNYINAQVTTPEEIAMSRFRREGYSTETSIELDTREAIHEADGSPAAGADGTAPANDTAAVADLAMNGAQVTSLQGIVTAAAANELPVGTAREIIAAAFPELLPERIDRMLAPIAEQAGAVTQLADANTKLATITKSHASLKNVIKRLIAKYGHSGSVVGMTGSGAGVSDEELDAAVAEVETAEDADASADGAVAASEVPDANG